MYVSIRRYEGIEPGSAKEITRRVQEGLVPLIRSGKGFVAYYAIDAGDGVVASISVFESQSAAEASNLAAASWVKENLAVLIPNPPQVTTGEVTVYQVG